MKRDEHAWPRIRARAVRDAATRVVADPAADDATVEAAMRDLEQDNFGADGKELDYRDLARNAPVLAMLDAFRRAQGRSPEYTIDGVIAYCAGDAECHERVLATLIALRDS